MRTFYLTAAASLLLDQLSKLLVANYLFRPLVLLPGLAVLRHVQNPGAAFGLFAQRNLFLILAGFLLVLIFLLAYNRIRQAPLFWRAGAGLILGGTLGNLLDRLRLGHVVDFIDLGFWPVFNLADIAITCGVGIIILSLLRERSEWS
ncbi:MAG: signal peptidase II [Bacillota bacterium]